MMIHTGASACADPTEPNMLPLTCVLQTIYNRLRFAQLQRKAELVAGYAAITGMRIAEHKLRTYHVRGWQDDLRQSASDKGL